MPPPSRKMTLNVADVRDQLETIPCNNIKVNVELKKDKAFKGQHIEDGQPVTLPVKNLQELLAWTGPDEHDPGQAFMKSSVPRAMKEIADNGRKTLVMHDMMGNYLNDKSVFLYLIVGYFLLKTIFRFTRVTFKSVRIRLS